MMARPRAWIAWSSGKDSAWALHEVRRSGAYEIVCALTTVADTLDRVSVHGVREGLLRAQVESAGLRSHIVRIPFPCPNEMYEAKMAAAMQHAKAEGATHVIFGDLFLADIRAYREAQLAKAGMQAVFPLWGRPTAALAREMIAAGIEAHLVCVDLGKIPASNAGRRFTADLLEELPVAIDRCGENGEFHTFVSAGPMLSRNIAVAVGETARHDGFAYADLVPAT